jgi:hypothetical protein
LAASQKGFVHSFGTGIGLVTLLQSFMDMVSSLPIAAKAQRRSASVGRQVQPEAERRHDVLTQGGVAD